MGTAASLRCVLAAIAAVAALSCPVKLSAAPLTIAVADFDYLDTSGEPRDQTAEHQARVARFAELLRASLAAQGDYRVLPLQCDEPPCTPINMQPDHFIAAARRSGARFVVYGGIHKSSTLVQSGSVELFDLETDRLLLKRTVSFRGDTDEAFSRAAAFVGETLRDAMAKK